MGVSLPATNSYRNQINRANALSRVAKEGGAAVSAPARRAFLDKFRTEVDPDNLLAPEDREARADAAMRAHVTRMAAASAKVRQTNASREKAKIEAATLRKLADGLDGGAAHLLSQACLFAEVKDERAPGVLECGTLLTWGDLSDAVEIIQRVMDQIEPDPYQAYTPD